jgi:methionine--tRNA ligase beta chain
MISFADFKEMDLRVGTITEASVIEDADKLLLLTISVGDEDRQVVSGIRSVVDDADELINTQVIFLANLEPKEIFGYESQGMILAARDGDKISLTTVVDEVSAGSQVS